jgi:hypothetical protein
MNQHVFTRIAGFRLCVIPRVPFRICRADAEPGGIDVEYHSLNGGRFARLLPKDGGYTSLLDDRTESLFDVLDVEPGPDLDYWRLETTVFTCAWPEGYALHSNNSPEAPGPFDLVGGNDEVIYVQHPRQLPAIEEMCAPNQSIKQLVKDSDSEWIELEYTHEGSPWFQRHEIVSLPEQRVAVTLATRGSRSTPRVVCSTSRRAVGR